MRSSTPNTKSSSIKSRGHSTSSPRWRFQRLARGTGSGLDGASYAELVKPSTDVPPTTFRSVEPQLFERILDQTLAGPGNAGIGEAWCPPCCVKREVDILGAGSSSPPRPYYRLGLPHVGRRSGRHQSNRDLFSACRPPTLQRPMRSYRKLPRKSLNPIRSVVSFQPGRPMRVRPKIR